MIKASLSAIGNLTEQISIGRGEKGETGDVTPEALEALSQAEAAANQAQTTLNQIEVYANDVALAREAADTANQAAENANTVKDEVLRKLAAGELKGDTGPQGPQGIPGPKGDTGPQGEKGAEGAAVITSLSPGMFGLSVNSDGHLILAHNDNEPAPPLEITEDGRLIYTIS